MWRFAKLILAVILCAAALVPPRLHASMPGHDTAGHRTHGHFAQSVMVHDHADGDCVHGPAAPVSVPDMAQSICIAACACLPVAALPVPLAQPLTHGEKLAALNTAMPALPQPDGLFRPPRRPS